MQAKGSDSSCLKSQCTQHHFGPSRGHRLAQARRTGRYCTFIGLKQSGAAPAKAPLLLCLLWPTGKNAAKSCRQASSTSSTKPRHDRAPSTMKSRPQFAPFFEKKAPFLPKLRSTCARFGPVLAHVPQTSKALMSKPQAADLAQNSTVPPRSHAAIALVSDPVCLAHRKHQKTNQQLL